VAREIAEQASWQIWSRSGDADVDELFALGLRQMRTDPETAVATYSRIIETRPDFAEGWNKRATLYYMMGRLDESLKDCDEVMKRNPYHFGALSGYGQIYLRLEKYERALDYFMRALKVNPNMDSVRELVRQLRMFLGEQPERYI
jgi:tetratricopeptide (TPR) repeat protein